MKKLFAVMMALCLALSLSTALADQTLEGDANVDQRNYPSTAPFIHPPFYNVMDYSAHTDAALSQIRGLGIVGSWKADLSAYGEDYAAIDLRMSIDEAGHGVTVMDGAQTADFEAYAMDNGEKDDGIGLYVAYSNLDYEAEAAPYTLTVNDAGQMVLTLTADDGAIS